MNILVVDETQWGSIVREINSPDDEITVISDIDTGLQHFRNRNFDVVIVGFHYIDDDALDTIERFTSLRRAYVAVVANSLNRDDYSNINALGADYFDEKSFTISAIRSFLSEVTESLEKHLSRISNPFGQSI